MKKNAYYWKDMKTNLRRGREMLKGDVAAQERKRIVKLEERKRKAKEGKFKLKEQEDKRKRNQ